MYPGRLEPRNRILKEVLNLHLHSKLTCFNNFTMSKFYLHVLMEFRKLLIIGTYMYHGALESTNNKTFTIHCTCIMSWKSGLRFNFLNL